MVGHGLGHSGAHDRLEPPPARHRVDLQHEHPAIACRKQVDPGEWRPHRGGGATGQVPPRLGQGEGLGPAAQGFMDWATAQGAVPHDGLGMLVEQAAEAFALWRGIRPQTAPVLAMLRAPEVTA